MSQIVGDVWEPASRAHWLGTDNLGRDLLTRMIYGGRTTIFVATAATLIAFTLGSVWASPRPSTAAGWIRACPGPTIW